MDCGQAIALTSTWRPSANLQALLRVKKKLESFDESETGVGVRMLLTAKNEQSCFLHIDLGSLSGSVVCGVELVSQARTIEVYEGAGQDYITTVKGIATQDSDMRLYVCSCELPNDTHFGKLSLKLLSLCDKTQVTVDQLVLEVSEYSETKQETSHVTPTLPNQFLASLSSRELPPFLRTLVSSLQSMPAGDDTSDVSKMANAFKQVHSALSTAEPKQDTAADSTSSEPVEGPSVNHEHNELALLLEEKLKRYIDDKFADFEKKIESKLEALSASLAGHRAEVRERGQDHSGWIDDLAQLD